MKALAGSGVLTKAADAGEAKLNATTAAPRADLESDRERVVVLVVSSIVRKYKYKKFIADRFCIRKHSPLYAPLSAPGRHWGSFTLPMPDPADLAPLLAALLVADPPKRPVMLRPRPK